MSDQPRPEALSGNGSGTDKDLAEDELDAAAGGRPYRQVLQTHGPNAGLPVRGFRSPEEE
jgi:hypothetical protein